LPNEQGWVEQDGLGRMNSATPTNPTARSIDNRVNIMVQRSRSIPATYISATYILTCRPRVGKEAQSEQQIAELIMQSATFPGYLGTTSIEPDHLDNRRYGFRLADQASLDYPWISLCLGPDKPSHTKPSLEKVMCISTCKFVAFKSLWAAFPGTSQYLHS
jgi:hypothetical protein